MSENSMNDLLTAYEVAQRLGISSRKVYDLASSGELASHRFGSAVRFAPADVEEYKGKCRHSDLKLTPAPDLKQADVLRVLLECIPNAQTKAWRRAVVRAFEEAEDDEGDFRDAVHRLRLVPDAYLIDKEKRELHFFEVEVHNPMSADKLREYAVFTVLMDFYEIEFAVFAVNRHGHIHQMDLMPHYAAWLKEVAQ